MKDWLQRQLSSDQAFADKILSCLLAGFVLYLAIGISWFLLFLTATYLIKFCKWTYKKTGGSNSGTEERLYNLEYFIEKAYRRLNVFKWNSNLNEKLSPTGRRFKLAKGVFSGIVAIMAAFAFVYSLTGNPYHEYLLFTNGTTTKGFIIEAYEDAIDDDRGVPHFSFYYTYTFETSNGKTITADGNSDGRLPDELSELSGPHPTMVVYLKSNPEISKLKQTLSDSLWEIVWRKIGLGTLLLLMFSSIGFLLIGNAFKKYSTETKKLTSGNKK